MARCGGDGLARNAAHRAWVPRRWPGRRGSRRAARDDEPTSTPTVRATRGGFAHRRGDDPTGATRERARRRDRDANVRDCLRRGLRQHPTIQRRVSRRVSEVADGGSPSEAQARERQERHRALGETVGSDTQGPSISTRKSGEKHAACSSLYDMEQAARARSTEKYPHTSAMPHRVSDRRRGFRFESLPPDAPPGCCPMTRSRSRAHR